MSELERYRKFYAWQEAVKLSLELYRMADELPDDEQHLLARDLRRSAVEIPTAVAVNVVRGEAADTSIIVRLQVIMELIGKIYPALDTARTETEIAKVASRMQGNFTEQEPEPEPTPAPAVEPAEEEAEPEDDADEDADEDYRGNSVHQVDVSQGN
jgi:hypothetical protein